MKAALFDSTDDPEIIESILKHARSARKHAPVDKAGTALKVELFLSKSLAEITGAKPVADPAQTNLSLPEVEQ